MQKPFMPTDADTVSISASSTSARVALDQNSSAVRVYNAGPGVAFITFGGSSVTSTVNRLPVPVGAVEKFTKGGTTHVAAICAGADTATLRFTNGEGL